jgi:hypothetical protein
VTKTSLLQRLPAFLTPIGVPRLESAFLALTFVAAVSLTANLVVRDGGPDDVAAASASSAGNAAGVPLLVVVGDGSATDEAVGRPAAEVTGGMLLAVPRGGMSTVMHAALSQSRPDRILIVGGPAVVSDATVAALARYTAGPTTRLAGADRYETAALVARSSFRAPVPRLQVMSGDAAGGPVAAAGREGSDAPLLLIERDRVPGVTASALRQLRPGSIEVLGASSVISDDTLDQLRAFSSGDVRRQP